MVIGRRPSPGPRVPLADDPDASRGLSRGDRPAPALDRLCPARRHQTRCDIGKRGEDEEPLAQVAMWDLEPLRRLRLIEVRVDRARIRRPVDIDALTAVDQQVEVDLARPPAGAGLAAFDPFDPLQIGQQGERIGRGVGRAAPDVERGNRIPELRLVGEPPWGGRVETRHGSNAGTRQIVEGGDGVGQAAGGVAQVRAETDVGTDDPAAAHRAHLTIRRCDPRSVARRMTDVDVVILHVEPDASARPLTQATAAARLDLAERHRQRFVGAGAASATVLCGPADPRPFGARLRDLARGVGDGGLVVLGSGAIPRATSADRRELVEAAAATRPGALTNNRYSADVIAVARARSVLADVPDLATDNMLPRWLEEHAGIRVADRRERRRLGMDIDGPLDLILLGGRWKRHLARGDAGRAEASLGAVRRVAADPRAELLVAGRSSAANLAWLERYTASRTRALIEERGLRARAPGQRPAASVLGELLDRAGPGALGDHVARLGDAAIIDSRVLLAHHVGADEAAWPVPEDRFASDLLLPKHIADPWLHELTASAVAAPVPVLLGGHSLVGPGLPLALRPRR